RRNRRPPGSRLGAVPGPGRPLPQAAAVAPGVYHRPSRSRRSPLRPVRAVLRTGPAAHALRPEWASWLTLVVLLLALAVNPRGTLNSAAEVLFNNTASR